MYSEEVYKSFNRELEKKAGALSDILRYVYSNPKRVAVGVLGTMALASLLPKMYTYSNENEKKDMMWDTNNRLENISMGNQQIAQLLTPAPQPQRDEFIYV